MYMLVFAKASVHCGLWWWSLAGDQGVFVSICQGLGTLSLQFHLQNSWYCEGLWGKQSLHNAEKN